MAIGRYYEDKCLELAGEVLSNELATSIQGLIENYLAFEKGKSRYSCRGPT